MEDNIEAAARTFNIRGVFLTAIISALSFVVALFWRDAIKGSIDKVVPQGETLGYLYLSAILVTIIFIAAIWMLYRAEKMREDKFLEKLGVLGKKELKKLANKRMT